MDIDAVFTIADAGAADADLRERPESRGRELALKALRDITATVIVARMNRKAVAAASFRVQGAIVKLINIGSTYKGAGRALIEFVRQLTGRPIWCKGLWSAAGFYEVMGMRRGLPVAVGHELAYIYSDPVAE